MALALDLVFGEPPRPFHPVVWAGKVISLLERGGYHRRPLVQFLYGMAVTLFTIALFAVPVYFAVTYLKEYSLVAYVVVGALLLKPAFCLKQQQQVVQKVSRLLSSRKPDEEPPELRKLFSTISRDGQSLPRPLIASASIRSLAENGSDFFVAPLFYFLFLGVPGAIAYRVVNTLDSMLGHHGKYEYLGKFAARLDDVLNYIPARLTALLLVLAAFLTRMNGIMAWRTALGEYKKTESPNAGWPMAAMAGALGIRLEKVGSYIIGEGGAVPAAEATDASLRVFQVAMLIWAAICLGAIAGMGLA